MTKKRETQSRSGTRQRILEVASRLFAEGGYAGTSVRDIATELGIANPSLYYHFESKEKLLLELMKEPLARVQAAVVEAEQLSGDARTRRIIAGLLEALEVHSAIVVTARRDLANVLGQARELPMAMQPTIKELLAHGIATDRRDLRVTMAIGAVEGVVMELMRSSEDSDTFVSQLRQSRENIIDLALQILR